MIHLVWLFLFIIVYWWGNCSIQPIEDSNFEISNDPVYVYDLKHFIFITVFFAIWYLSSNYDYENTHFYKKYHPIYEKYKLIIILFLISSFYFLGWFTFLFYMMIYVGINHIKELTFFKTFFSNFKKDSEIIKTHYLEEFRYFYYFRDGVRIVTFFVFFSPFFISQEIIEYYLPIIGRIYQGFIIVTIIDLCIILFIIRFRNTTPSNPILQGCLACMTAAGSIHFICYSPMADPTDPIVRAYHTWSPLGRGFLVYTREDLVTLEHVRGKLRSNFDLNVCLDDNNYLDMDKLAAHAKSYGYNLPSAQNAVKNMFPKPGPGLDVSVVPKGMEPEATPGSKFTGLPRK